MWFLKEIFERLRIPQRVRKEKEKCLRVCMQYNASLNEIKITNVESHYTCNIKSNGVSKLQDSDTFCT